MTYKIGDFTDNHLFKTKLIVFLEEMQNHLYPYYYDIDHIVLQIEFRDKLQPPLAQ